MSLFDDDPGSTGYPDRVLRDEVYVNRVAEERPKLKPRVHCVETINSKTGEPWKED